MSIVGIALNGFTLLMAFIMFSVGKVYLNESAKPIFVLMIIGALFAIPFSILTLTLMNKHFVNKEQIEK